MNPQDLVNTNPWWQKEPPGVRLEFHEERLREARDEAAFWRRWLGFVACIAAVSISAVALSLQTTKAFKEQAVRRGYASWVIDTNSLSVKFQWKEAAK